MPASDSHTAAIKVDLMSGDAYRESLRSYKPKVFVDGREVSSVADDPALRPGVNALAFTYDYALRPELEPIALANQARRNRVVSRMLHVNDCAGDLLNKLEAVRVLCQETGCAQRYLAHDALNGIAQAVERIVREVALGAAGLLAEHPHGFELVQEVASAIVHMEHAAHHAVAPGLIGQGDGLQFRPQGVVVGERERIDAGAQGRVVRDAGNFST